MLLRHESNTQSFVLQHVDFAASSVSMPMHTLDFLIAVSDRFGIIFLKAARLSISFDPRMKT